MTLTATTVHNVAKPAVALMLLFILQSCSNKPAGVSYPVKSQELGHLHVGFSLRMINAAKIFSKAHLKVNQNNLPWMKSRLLGSELPSTPM